MSKRQQIEPELHDEAPDVPPERGADESSRATRRKSRPERPVARIGVGTGLSWFLPFVVLFGLGCAIAGAVWFFYDPPQHRGDAPKYALNPAGPKGSVILNPGPEALARLKEEAETVVVAPEPELGPEEADRGAEIQALLDRAKGGLESLRLTTPEEDSAFYYFQQVLDIDPDNRAALDGLTEIATRYAWLVERELGRGDPQRARHFLELGLSVRPDHPQLNALAPQVASLEAQRTAAQSF